MALAIRAPSEPRVTDSNMYQQKKGVLQYVRWIHLVSKIFSKENASCLFCVKQNIHNFSVKTVHSGLCVHLCKTARFSVRNSVQFVSDSSLSFSEKGAQNDTATADRK